MTHANHAPGTRMYVAGILAIAALALAGCATPPRRSCHFRRGRRDRPAYRAVRAAALRLSSASAGEAPQGDLAYLLADSQCKLAVRTRMA